MKRFLCAVVLLFPGLAYADGIDIFLNDRTVSAEYLTVWGGSDVGFGGLYNKNGDVVAHGSILVFGREQARRSTIEGGIGGKLYAASIGGTSVAALGIGGQITVFPRGSRFGFGGYGYYAPDILSANVRGLIEGGARAEFRMFDNASIFLGIHRIHVETAPGTTTMVDDGVHFGVNIRF